MLLAAVMLSLCGLFVGPTLALWARGRHHAVAAMDAATLALVPGLILVRFVPHLVEEAGVTAIGCVIGGYVGLQLLEARAHRHSTQLGLAIVLPTLTLHSFIDGAALAIALGGDVGDMGTFTLAAALILHRIPEGMFFASAMTDLGVARTRLALGVVAVATILGSLIGRGLLDRAPDHAPHLIVAVGLGVMLRFVIHRHDAHDDTRVGHWVGGLTFLGCVIFVVAIPTPQHLFALAQPGELAIGQALVPLFLETSVIFLGVLVVSAIANRVRPRSEYSGDSGFPAAILTLWLLGPVFGLFRGFVFALMNRGTSALRTLLPAPGRLLPSYTIGLAISIAAEAALPARYLAGADALSLPAVVIVAGYVWSGGCGAPLVAAVLLHKGASVVTVAAYLLAGATWLGRPLVVWRELVRISCVVSVAFAIGPMLRRVSTPDLHELGRQVHPLVEWICATIVALWIAIDLSRAGPRAWLAREA